MADKNASKKSAKKSAPSKADFVRSQPRAMPAKDLVEKAKAEGIALTDSYVYKLRSSKKPKGAGAGKPGRAPGKRRGRKPGSGSKTAFVLSLPLDLPAADVVKKAAEKGIKISDKYVYTIRSSSKRKGGAGANGAAVARGRTPGRRGPGRPPKALSAVTHAVSGGVRHGGIEQEFVRLAVALGTARAGELLRKLDIKLASLTVG